MASLVIAAAGAALGSALIPGTVLGMSGASIGWLVGSALATPKIPNQNVQGPRLSDLTVQASTEGAAIPEVWGTWRMSGNVIWATDLIETVSTESHGGGKGGGGGKTSTTTYSYSASWAVGLCEGEIAAVRRIWADGKLIYERDVSDALPTGVTVYTGSETQDPDPTIEADVGAADTPAYRGLAYMVFANIPLADYGNRVPQVSVEVDTLGGANFTLYTDSGFYIPNVAIPLGSRVYGAMGPDEEAPEGSYFDSSFARTSIAPLTFDKRLADYLIFESGAGNITTRSMSLDGSTLVADGIDLTFDVAYPASSVDCPKLDFTIAGTFYHYAYGDTADEVFVYTSADGLDYTYQQTLADYSTLTAPQFFDEVGTYRAWELGSTGCVVFSGSGSATPKCWVTSDGETWTGTAVGATNTDMGSWKYGSTLWIGLGSSNVLYKTTNGTTLTQFSSAVFSPGRSNASLAVFGSYVYAGWGSGETTVYRSPATANGALLSDIVTDLCAAVGVAAGDIDVADLTDEVRGYARTGPMTARAAIEPLQSVYLFDVVESSGVIKFPKRGSASVATIDGDDLVLDGPDAEPLTITRAQEVELPNEIALKFADADRDHQPGVVYARRLVTESRQTTNLELPLLADSATLQQSADVLIRDAWRSRTRYALTLPPAYLYLDPCDVITVTRGGSSHLMRLTGMTSGPLGSISAEAVAEDVGAYTSTAGATDDTWVAPVPLGAVGDTTGLVLDLPALTDVDGLAPTVYLAGRGQTGERWPSAVAYKSSDGGSSYDTAAVLPLAATMGTTSTALPTGRSDIVDESSTVTLTLETEGAALASVSLDSLLAGANACALGADGRWEILQFRSAVEDSPGVYTLSGLLRGRKGTEHAMALHEIGDTFVLLESGNVTPDGVPATDYGMARPWKFVTSGQALGDVTAANVTLSDAAMKPYSPVHLGGGRSSAGDITINWTRRNRLDNTWRDNVDVPMSEASEAYEIDVYSDNSYATVLRTIAASSETASYAAADQVTDFGSTQATVYCKVYQLSATVGRGIAASATV